MSSFAQSHRYGDLARRSTPGFLLLGVGSEQWSVSSAKSPETDLELESLAATTKQMPQRNAGAL